ncbi:UNVERIFIED_CONTAM: hypothetical protein K2H54_055589 [Gekko kuhli]
MVVGTGALVPARPSSAAQTGPVPVALPGGLTPAVLEAFWDSPVSRAIIDRLAGIERRLDGSAASAQNDMSSLELFQAEVLHRLDAIEQRSAVAPSSSVVAAIEDSRPVQMEVEVTGRRGVAQQEVTAEVPVHGSAAQPVINVAPVAAAGVQPADGVGVLTPAVSGPAPASVGVAPPSGSGQEGQGGVLTGCAPVFPLS